MSMIKYKKQNKEKTKEPLLTIFFILQINDFDASSLQAQQTLGLDISSDVESSIIWPVTETLEYLLASIILATI